MRNITNVQRKTGIGLLLLLLLLLLCLPASSTAAGTSKSFTGDGWKGTVRNVEITSFDVVPVFKLKIKTKWGIPYGGSITIDFKLKVGVKGQFDVTFTKANLPESYTYNTRIPSTSMYLKTYDLGESIFNKIPDVGLASLKMNMELVGGATQPVHVTGKFTNFVTLKIGTSGASTNQDTTFDFETIEPLEPDKKTVVYLGARVKQSFKAGKVGWKKFSAGPFMTVSTYFTSAGQAEAILHKDEWHSESDSYYKGTLADPEPDVIHSCTEEGKKGCVSGKVSNVQDAGGSVKISLTIAKIDILKKSFDISKNYALYNTRNFVQSLTWKESLKYAGSCSHQYYKVPVQVWGDQAHTVALKGIKVEPVDLVDWDSNMKRFTSGVTGENEYLVARYAGGEQNGKGRANLYLPYKNGKYTIRTDTYGTKYKGMNGSEAQPSAMVRGANETVHIVLDSDRRVTMKVRKKWDIDFEDKDRPDHVDVLLQRNSWNANKVTKFFRWVGVEKVTLHAGNNWEYTFEDLPRYEVDENGKLREIKYRIRELRQPETGDAEADEPFMLDINNIQSAQGVFGVDDGALAAESKRVVNDQLDLDNINIAGAFKDSFSPEKLWEISPDLNYLKSFGKKLAFVAPAVVYPVEEYTNLAGKTVEKHNTKYRVGYKTEETFEAQDNELRKTVTTTITNTAILDMTMYKRWLMFGDAEKPDSVLLALCYRVHPDYVDLIPGGSETAGRFAQMWIPVYKPIDGNKINILETLGLDTLAKFDLLNLASFPVAVAKVKKPESSYTNPLTAWRAKFTVKKYGFLGIDGIPVEFQAAELSSIILQDVVKAVTGFDLPVSTSIIDFFKGKPYITVPGKMYEIPYLDKNWERTGNVINIWAGLSADGETAVGGTKYWINDKEEDRPDEVKIMVTGRHASGAGDALTKEIILKKADYTGLNDWVWGLTTTDPDVKAWLQALKTAGIIDDAENADLNSDEFTWEVSEDCPDGYTSRTEGFDLFNTRGETPQVMIVKRFEDKIPSSDTGTYDFTITVKDTDGHVWSETVSGARARGEEGDIAWIIREPELSIKGKDVSRFTVEETANSAWISEVTGPDESVKNGSPVYTFTVTNRYQDSKAKIEIRKEWKGDQEADRPDSVTVNLKRNGTVFRSVSLTKGGGWKATVSDLPAIDTATGKPYSYTAEEETPEGYKSAVSVSSSKSGTGTTVSILLTNEWTGTEEYVSLEGKKTWEGDDEASRPDKLYISILPKGGRAVRQVETSAASGWQWKVTGLPRYDENGDEIEYQVIEGTEASGKSSLEVPGYTVDYRTPTFDETTLTWTADIINRKGTVSIGVSKRWTDDDNRYGLRPETVKVHLIRNSAGGDSSETGSAELNAADGWDHNFKGLPEKDGDGNPYTYTLEEDPVKGYSMRQEPDEVSGAGGFTLTNSIDENYINIPVRKVWAGDETVQDARPAYVTVRLTRMEGGREVPVTETGEDGSENEVLLILKAGSGWEGEFRGLPEKDENGNRIEYSVDEDPVSGYSDETVTGDQDAGFTITNTFNNKMIIRVVKSWAEAGTENVTHPDSITYEVTGTDSAGGKTTLSRTISGDSWTDSFEAAKYDSAMKEISYTIEETFDAGEDYESSVSAFESDQGLEIIITNTRVYREMKIRKVWDDDHDLLRNRPGNGAVKVDLYADGEKWGIVQLQPEGGSDEAETVLRLPVYDSDGQQIFYTVQEPEQPAGYTSEITGDMSEGYTITNSLQRTDISVQKQWSDNEDAAGKRPESVNVRLIAVGGGKRETVDTVRLSSANDWSYVFRGRGLYMDGEPCAYEVAEDPADGYTAEISGTWEDGFTILNRMDTVRLSVTKVWGTGFKGRTYTDGSREIPGKVKMQILQKLDGEKEDAYKLYTTLEMTSADLYVNGSGEPILTVHEHYQWRKQIDVPKCDEKGTQYVYDVREPAAGIEMSSDVQKTGDYSFTVINTTGKRRMNAYIINVVWDDMENRYNLRPDYIQATLVFKDEESRDFLAVDGSEYWSAVYETERTVIGVAADTVRQYSSRVTQDSERVFTITYKLDPPETANVMVTKEWEDGGDVNGRRPESVTVGLYRAGDGGEAQLVRTHALTEQEGWAYTFEDLPVREIDGTKQYTYTIGEMTHPEGYTTAIRKGKESTSGKGNLYVPYTITNTFPLTDVTVSKVWDDEGVAETTRPDSVEVILLADGNEAKRVSLTEDSGWSYTFRNLPEKNNDGTGIVYSVEETPMKGYADPAVTSAGKNSFKITNTAVTLDIKVTKAWEHNGNPNPPESVRLVLTANGEEYAGFTATASEPSHTFSGLPTFDAEGNEIIYGVEEEQIPDGYTMKVSGSEASGFTVTNTFAVRNIHVSKEWEDEDDAGNHRPAAVTVYLKSDREKAGTMATAAELTLSAAGNWEGTFPNMPVYAAGNRVISYSVEEEEIANYGEPIIAEAGSEFVIYNWVIDPDKTVVIVDKEWERAEGLELPDSVTVQLMRNGAVFGEPRTISAEPDGIEDVAAPWRIVYMNLSRSDENGQIYDYSITEVPVDGYTTRIVEDSDTLEGSRHTFRIINTAKSVPVNFEGMKTVAGRELLDSDAFTFAVFDEAGQQVGDAVRNDETGKIVFPTIRYTAEDAGKTFTYTVKETGEGGNGITIDPTVYTVTVKVTADADGTVTAELSENAKNLVFTNRYEAAGSVTFKGKKTVDGRAMTQEDVFSFEITETGTENRWVAQNDAAGQIQYPVITYALNENTDDTGIHTYRIRELDTDREGILKDETVYTVTVEVRDDGKGGLTAEAGTNAEELDFTNEAAAYASVTFRGTKSVVGREMADDDLYTFEITETGTENRWTVQNTADGKIPYPKITYYKGKDRDDTGTHIYRVREADTDGDGITIDRTVYTVTVEVSEGEDGTLQAEASTNASALDFVNSYGISGSITFRGTKTVFGREWADDDIYTFEITEPATGNKWTVQNDSTGKILYPAIWYVKNEKQDDTGTHIYKVREADTDGDGITIDRNEYTVTVEVTDDEWGNLIIDASGDAWELDFVNEYGAEGDITFAGTKTVTGRAWEDDDIYTFEVREKGNSDNRWEVTNDETGKILYPAIHYTLRDLGQHIYEVKETDPNEEGLQTDRTLYTVVVNVEDDEWGNLIITATDNAQALDFVNRYGATGSITFEGTKRITGREWDDDDIYTFEILEKDSLNRWTAENDRNGKILFPEIDYVLNDTTDDTGTHIYYVREINMDVEGIRSDKRLYEVTVTVKDNGSGGLEVTASDNAKALDFENQFGITGSFYFSGIKQLEGQEELTADDTFLYEIAEDGTDNKWYVTNDRDGQILYPRIGFVKNEKTDETGRHTYTVREVKTDRGDIAHFDETVYTTTVEVSVSEDKKTLVVKTEDAVKGADFTNTLLEYTITYDPNGGILDGQKGPVTEKHRAGSVITIRNAPSRDGYTFRYWKGSEYQPGDKYKVTDNHTFTAQWQSDSPYTHQFTFTKKWNGGTGDSISWTLYNPDGTEAHKLFDKTTVSSTEWRYSAWFTTDTEYYIIEDVPKGYKARYVNVGKYADVTDRCYNGGTIINSTVPKTGDDSNIGLWILCVVLGAAGLASLAILRRRGRKKHDD